MKLGSVVKYTYVDRFGKVRQTEMMLTREMVSEKVMSDEEVESRLNEESRKLGMRLLLECGEILAARCLLKKVPDAREIVAEEPLEEKNNASKGGGAIFILLILAVIVAIVCFPLMVMLGMHGKFFLSRVYRGYAGARYKKFAKLYTFIGIGFYVAIIVMMILGKVIPVPFLSENWIYFMLYGGIAYFGISLLILRLKFKDYGALDCDACGEKAYPESYDEFDELVRYKVVKEKFDIKTMGGNGGRVLITGRYDAVVAVKFYCPYCNQTKNFHYAITPFKCEISEKNVAAGDVERVTGKLEKKIADIMALIKQGAHEEIPYTIHSVCHPDYEQGKKNRAEKPVYNGVTINFHRGVEEMVEGFFLRNEADGKVLTRKAKN